MEKKCNKSSIDITEYISIYKVFELLCPEGKSLENKQNRMKFEALLDLIPLNIIGRIKLDEEVNLKDGPPCHVIYCEKDVVNFLESNITEKEFQDKLGVSDSQFRRIIKKHNIKHYKLGYGKKLFYMSKRIAEKIYKGTILKISADIYKDSNISENTNQFSKDINDEYLSIYDVAKLVGKDIEPLRSSQNKNRFKRFLNELPKGMIQAKKLDQRVRFYKGFPPDDEMYSKVDIYKFVNENKSKAFILEKIANSKKFSNAENRFFDKYIKERDIPVYYLGYEINFKFVPWKSVMSLTEFSIYKNEETKFEELKLYITSIEFAKLLGIHIGGNASKSNFETQIKESINYGMQLRYKVVGSKIEINTYRDNFLINKQDVDCFLDSYINMKDAFNLFNKKGIKIEKTILKKKIPFFYLGNQKKSESTFLLKNKVYDLLNSINEEDFVTIFDILEKIGYSSKPNFTINFHKSISLFPCPVIGIEKLDYEISLHGHKPQKIFYYKNDVETFFYNYISLEVICKNLGVKNSRLTDILIKNKVKSFEINKQSSGIFISREDYQVIKSYLEKKSRDLYKHPELGTINIKNYYTKRKLNQILNLNEKQLYKFLDENEIRAFYILNKLKSRNYEYFKIEIIDSIVVEQKKLLKYFTENYYSVREIKEKYENGRQFLNYITGVSVQNGDVEAIECPTILLGYILPRSGKLYRKEDIDRVYLERSKRKQLNELSIDDPYDEFIYKIENILQINFTEKLKNTKDLWYQFVKKDLYNSNTINIKSRVNEFVKTTQFLVGKISKEIFSYTSYELNKLIFQPDNEIFLKSQMRIYSFCKRVVEVFLKESKAAPFVFEKLNNPLNYSKKIEHDQSMYTFEEYQELYNYVNDGSFHKKRAIESVELLLNKQEQNSYDSCWLYVMLHLTNNWRHSTIISQIPRIDLSNTNISSLDWLKENTPTIDEANDIIFQIGRYVKKINKTGAESEFIIGEPLKIAFAIAISICEIRTRMILPSSSELIWLGKTVSNSKLVKDSNPHKLFFSHFREDFEFANRKMNRTLTTLIWSVTRSLNDAQVSRSHFNEDTTMHYIELNEIQLKQLDNQIYERGTFGYISQSMTKILFGEVLDKQLETKRMNEIVLSFGNVQKIEITSGLLNRISEERDDVITFLNAKTKEEIEYITLRSMTNTLYSKKRYFQCVFSECKYGVEKDCIDCSYSLVNVYALSNLMDHYVKHIVRIIEKFDNVTEGEKRKMANQFYLIWLQVNEAKIRFGEVIYDFVEGGRDRFNELSYNLPKMKSIITLDQDTSSHY